MIITRSNCRLTARKLPLPSVTPSMLSGFMTRSTTPVPASLSATKFI